MVIGITAAILISISIGVTVVLLAAAAMTRRSVELDPGLEEQPVEQWLSSGAQLSMNSSTQLRLS
ncbi:MAG: hypothetical protein BroJett021_42840 [Chloroflexota bacterium]|jgi:hypothetical protein|nr:MAG: hypothetical protein BroJett021_42840 [Chloroflexota bacterium]